MPRKATGRDSNAAHPLVIKCLEMQHEGIAMQQILADTG
jgi:hypothetical protein